MIIAIPVADGTLFSHFGHCKKFALIEVDNRTREIKGKREIDAPPHEPGILPSWLAERGVQVILCGGIGAQAVELLEKKEIKIVIGAPSETPENLVAAYLQGTLKTGSNFCDH